MLNKKFFVALISGAVSCAANAEIVRDGTLGSGDAALTATNGNYAITESMGVTNGSNLFHSFQTFNLSAGESATFSGASSIKNIVTRVTGDSASSINGRISSTIPGANFWFFNPKGIVFGAGASLDITGSFHASTADYVQFVFADDKFYADTSQLLLTPAGDPRAFGFINSATLNSALKVENTRLSVVSGKKISLVGNNITLSASVLEAKDGQVSVVSINESGEVFYSDQGFEAFAVGSNEPIDFSGNLTLSNTVFEVDGVRKGNIQLQGGDIEVNTNTTDVLPSVSNLKASFVEEVDLLDKPCELAEFHGQGTLSFTVDEEDEETRFGVEVRKSRGAIGFEAQEKCR